MTTLRKLIPTLIENEALSIGEIAERTGCTHQRVGEVMNQLRDSMPIYIESWLVLRGPHIARYRLGDKEDAPKPEYMSNTEKMKRYRSTEKGQKTVAKCRKRWRKTQAGKEYERRASSGRWSRKKFAMRGVAGFDPLLAAIMGVRA